MRYQGGKSKSAKQIADVITSVAEKNMREYNPVFVSLFCGSCAVESKLNKFKTKILNDKHEYLIALLQGVQTGYELPEHISNEKYQYIKMHLDEDKVLSGFVGFGCSFGGKWFGGYATNQTNRNYASETKRSLLKDMAALTDAQFICKDYHDVELPNNCVVYADPPYNGTTGYGNEKFDSDVFWDYMREISKNHLVFISEQNAPDDFIPIWEKQLTRTLDVNKNNQFKATEKLFVHKCNGGTRNVKCNIKHRRKGIYGQIDFASR